METETEKAHTSQKFGRAREQRFLHDGTELYKLTKTEGFSKE